MKVYLNKIDGIADAIVSMYFSKRSWTPEKDREIRLLCDTVLDRNGFLRLDADPEDIEKFKKDFGVLLKWGKKHITLLKYIDLSFTVEGLHRAGQDDWDAHAERMHNRIIRSSTRLSKFGNEMSEWYQGKIISTDMALERLGINLPATITIDGKQYSKVINGYVLDEYKEDKDVLRGLYMLSIPSNFIYRVDLANFAHIYKMRGNHGGANPEVKIVAETSCDLLEAAQPQITRDLLVQIES